MKIMLRGAIAALSFASIGAAYAGDGEGPVPNTRFTQIPGVIAQAPVQSAPPTAFVQNGHAVTAQNGQPAQNGQAVQTYVTRSNRGTWLFAPNQNSGSNS